MMFVTNYILAITAIVSSLVGFILMFIILNKSQKYFTKRQEELGNLNGYIEEVYSGLNVVKTCNAKEETILEFDKLNDKLSNKHQIVERPPTLEGSNPTQSHHYDLIEITNERILPFSLTRYSLEFHPLVLYLK